jgi:hypothetical protein
MMTKTSKIPQESYCDTWDTLDHRSVEANSRYTLHEIRAYIFDLSMNILRRLL